MQLWRKPYLKISVEVKRKIRKSTRDYEITITRELKDNPQGHIISNDDKEMCLEDVIKEIYEIT